VDEPAGNYNLIHLKIRGGGPQPAVYDVMTCYGPFPAAIAILSLEKAQKSSANLCMNT